MQSIEIPSI